MADVTIIKKNTAQLLNSQPPSPPFKASDDTPSTSMSSMTLPST
jgi:hypothetical protein